MKISDYSYCLPEELIAQFPPRRRGGSRLLALRRENGEIADRKYAEVGDFLRAGDVLVLNDTKVMRSRIEVVKANGARRELMILEKHGDDVDWRRHRVMYRGSLRAGDRLRVVSEKGLGSEMVVEEILGDGLAVIESRADLLKVAEKFGAVPLPPYMNRVATADDVKRYQTVFAKESGSAAAPTASLNMTGAILRGLVEKGVIVKYLTLHVGLGTFLPIRADEVEEHKMHAEYFEIPAETAAAVRLAKSEGRKVVAVGTTVARTLEYCRQELGADSSIISHSAEKVKKTDGGGETGGDKTGVEGGAICGEADIFIYPSYRFRVVDALITNFHAPKSTVLMLAAAFAGWENLRRAYLHATKEKYRFLSYGDSMLIY
jgi:S-adenosylmethionine:tRNA ribosyltransferase-isomerase